MPTDFETVEAQLTVAANFCRRLGTTTHVTIDLSADSAEKIYTLDLAGRPFLDITPEMSAAVTKAMQERIEDVYTSSEGTAAVGEIFGAGAEGVRRHIRWRFDAQGGDITLTPSGPGWKRYKAANGFSTLIGIYTGQLYEELETVRIEFT